MCGAEEDKTIAHVFRDCKEVNRLCEEMDKTFEERVGRQSTRDEKLNGFHPKSKMF
ncbi:Hypothetical protein FKW44_011975 [Caligus rogercresseyi]|uniref:Uncharacterized protein n=1 Tax=Caligus rogercresseyi TaxID=217165 RepID=A0A7T8HJC6_CALRO|nr:Hypothetical protein FKW44_011975 [Caligus rogercresseyi]